MRYNKPFYLFFLLILVCGCQSTDDEMPVACSDNPSQLIKIISQVVTRSAMEKGFEPADKIGVFMLLHAGTEAQATLTAPIGNWINNENYFLTADKQNWATSTPHYWLTGNTVIDVIGYYPYQPTINQFTNVSKLTVNVATDQSSLKALRESDFLYARQNKLAPSDNEGVELYFRHKLCKLTVSMQLEGKGASNLQPTITAPNLLTDATANLNTGDILTVSTNRSNITFYYDAITKCAEAILPPQTLSAGKLLTIELNDNNKTTLQYDISKTISMESGNEYNIPFTYNLDSNNE